MTKDGKIDAVVIGVGGFLGMGEHDVAVPLQEIKFVDEPRTTTSANNPPANAPRPSTAASTPPTRSDAPRSYPDHALLDMNKDQLKAAPQFRFR